MSSDPGRVRRETGVEHLAGLDVDEEEDVVAAQRGGVDGEEVRCDGGWEPRNPLQVTAERVGAGSMLLSVRNCQMFDDAMVWPRSTSSPWIRR